MQKVRLFFLSLWRKVIDLFVGFYPVLYGILIVWTKFVESTSNFLNVIFTDKKAEAYQLDYITIFLWFSIFLWAFINNKINKKKEADFNNRIESAIQGALNKSIFQKARLAFDSLQDEVKNLSGREQEFENENYDNIIEIEKFFSRTCLLMSALTLDFFNMTRKVGVNIMIYFDASVAENQQAIKYLLKKNPLYLRDNHEASLKGLLYLVPELSFMKNIGDEHPEIAIPIYKETERIYNSDHRKDEDQIFLPGAPTAYFKGSHFIINTKDKSNYEKLNDDTVTEILSYFKSEATKTRSLLSFRIPQNEENKECVGILNIDGTDSSDFKKAEDYFNTFYTLIYPNICMSIKYLEYYRRYIIKRIESEEGGS